MLETLFNHAHFKESVTGTSLETEKAKAYPIQKLYNGELKKTGRILMGCCPFHQDPTPSFVIYPETNTWNCFAKCGGGDSISYYMRLKGVNFQEAVKELSI